MKQFTDLFNEFLMKAIVMTEEAVAQGPESDYSYDLFTENRERLISVLDKIGQHIDWESVAEEIRTETSKRIDYLKSLDERLVVQLQEYKAEVQKKIESTHRNHEAVKGYNLNDVK
jgi:hypothetical protein